MALECTLFEKHEGVAVITLNRPDRMNALIPEMTQEIAQCLDEARADEDVRVVVITGAGKGFCAGADMAKLARRAGGEAPGRVGRRDLDLMGDWALKLHEFEKPSVAAVNGVAAGGGVSLALACDICIASDAARFVPAFTRRGVAPDAGASYFLPRRVSLARACALVFTGDPITAPEAERLGLVDVVVPHEQLLPAALELARKIARGAPLAMIMAKRALQRGATSDLRSALEFESFAQRLLFQTEDFREGVGAYLEKREPKFTGH